MNYLDEIIALENVYISQGEPTLGKAIRLLVERLEREKIDRDAALHLIFLIWYTTLEPPFLTGVSPHEKNVFSIEPIRKYFIKNEFDSIAVFILKEMIEISPWSFPGDECLWINEMERQGYTNDIEEEPIANIEGQGLLGQYFNRLIE